MSYINTCYHCEKEFPVKYKSQHTPDNPKTFLKYCSKECRSIVQSNNTAARNRARPKKVPVTYINICFVCNKEFPVFDKKKNDPQNKHHFKKCC